MSILASFPKCLHFAIQSRHRQGCLVKASQGATAKSVQRMIWRVDYTEAARQDLQDIQDYISGVLLEPVTAAGQVNRTMDSVDSLVYMPLRHRLYDNEPWRSRGLRVVPVDNYVVLYLPDESKKTVTIIRVMYGRRNIDRQLKQFE